MQPDFPAAHSMDTAWFAVDAAGHIAYFDTGESGPLPGVAQDHAANLYLEDFQLPEAAGSSTNRQEYRSDQVLAYQAGLFYYSHDSYSEISDPYERIQVPNRPRHMDQLPPEMRERLRAVTFSNLDFHTAGRLQPLEYYPCQIYLSSYDAYRWPPMALPSGQSRDPKKGSLTSSGLLLQSNPSTLANSSSIADSGANPWPCWTLMESRSGPSREAKRSSTVSLPNSSPPGPRWPASWFSRDQPNRLLFQGVVMDVDFPAAHSMDTCWFAVDRDGHVAIFDSGEAGAVPVEAFAGDATYSAREQSSQLLPATPAIHDLRGHRRPGADPDPEGLTAGVTGLVWAGDPVVLVLSSLEPVRNALAAGQAVEVSVSEHKAVLFQELSEEQLQHFRGLPEFQGCWNHYSWHDDDRSIFSLARHGFFVYQHLTENWISGPYGRMKMPAQPVHLDQLPGELPAGDRPFAFR